MSRYDTGNVKVSLLILSYNEIQGMRVVLPRIDTKWLHEVIIIDGGSTDGSIGYARSLGFRVLRQKGKGIIGGYQEGLEAITGDIVITFTPDNNMIPEKIPVLIAKIKEGYDMVVVSRYCDGARSYDDGVISRFGNWLFTAMVNVLFGATYTDVLGFYRAFRRDLIADLGIKKLRVSIDTQLCIRCAKRGMKVADIPGDEPPRIGGKSSRSIIVNGFIELWTIAGEFIHYSR